MKKIIILVVIILDIILLAGCADNNENKKAVENNNHTALEMEKALKNTKEGSLTKPFKYEDKWAVCFLKKFKSKYEMDEAVREKIRAAIGEQLFNEAVEKWMKKSRDSVVVLRAADKFKVK